MLGLLCLGLLVSPLIIYIVGTRLDRLQEARDQRIQDKCQQIATLFETLDTNGRKLARTYLQASNGDAYPFDLFMIEYYGGEHTVDTIWLPVRDFLNARDDEIKHVLAQELRQPGRYTIRDWTVALYQYVLQHQHEPQRKRTSLWSTLLPGR
ncbi:hypothetical protein QM565_15065 [Geitlerinema splendidum]|jgi:hypothetical protein|nr:hypothetical protein [Geitlerinema splendidum]